MAVRDRNLFAWQAYVITMAFVSVGLLLGMFFLWRSYSDLSKRYADQSTQMSNARQEYTVSEDRVKRLLAMLGKGEFTQEDMDSMAQKFADDEVLSEVEKEYAEQMKLFAPNDPASEKNLLKLPQQLLETIRIRNDQVDEAREREKDLQKQATETVQRETKARQDAETAQKKAEADLEAARQSHAAAIQKLNDEKQEIFAQFDAYKTDMDRKYNQLAARFNDLDAKSKLQEKTIAEQAAIIQQFRDPDFASPQGEIVKVANGATSIWINLGSADGLRVGVPFSVIDESEINISQATPKANLVVTEVVADHLARAKVELGSFDYRKTLVPGDKIYSPAWRPGRTVGFALVGMMDINGDGKDDSNQVRELIRIAGGNIDAEIDSQGVRNDKLPGMTPNTSFLVLGTDLGVGATNEDLRAEQAQRAQEYARFMSEAQSMGIIAISLDKMMGYLKTEGSNRTIPLGNRIRGEDFPIKASNSPPVSNGSVSEIFQKRAPK